MFPNSFYFPFSCENWFIFIAQLWMVSLQRRKAEVPAERWLGWFLYYADPRSWGYLRSVFVSPSGNISCKLPHPTGPPGRRLFTERWLMLAVSNPSPFRIYKYVLLFPQLPQALPFWLWPCANEPVVRRKMYLLLWPLEWCTPEIFLEVALVGLWVR